MLSRLTHIAAAKSLCSVLLTLVAPFAAYGVDPPKRVLIVSSESSSSIPAQIIERSFRSVLKDGSPAGVDTYTEYLDATRTRVSDYEQQLIAVLRSKYVGRKFDLIFALDTSALQVLLRNRSEIFQDSPIVFVTLDERNMAGLTLGSNVTGIWGEVNLRPNLELALTLKPETRKVVVLAGVSEFDQYWTTRAREDFAALQDRLEFTYLIGLNISELKTALANLPQNTIVFLLAVTRDNAGNSYTNLDVLRQISPVSSVPIYGATDAQLGVGIVGGKLISFEAIGTQMAQIGLRVLSGEKPESIAPQGIPSVTMFDWRELKRWGISEQQLPPGSIVRFKEPSLWEQYKWRIIGIISLCILQALLIAYLLFTRARRRNAEKESKRYARLVEAQHQQLEEIVSNTPGVVWEAVVDRETGRRKLQFLSDYVEKMLGYSPKEMLSTPDMGSAFIVDEDRDLALGEMDAVVSDGKERTLQFRWLAKDGKPRWVESNVVAIRDEGGEVTGLRGVTMDISDRKDAEEALRQSESRFRHMADTAPILIWTADAAMSCTYFNQRCQDLTGRGMQELLGEGWLDIVHEEDRQRCIDAYTAGYERKEPFVMDYRIRRPDGELRWLYDVGAPRLSSDGELIGYIGSCVDITDRKAAEEALRAAHEEVNQLKNQLEEENIYLQEEIKLQYNFEEIVGHSDALKYVLFKIEQVAPTDSTVLITGETGTGKELVARAIHSASRRMDRPLVKVNCAALSATLIESELFGHEKGSFTGASARTIGRFELANGATIFLDEIGELPLELQVKLLRVIQEGEFERLGSSKTIKADVRIIAATNRNLQTEVQRGLFREDLWYRLNVFPITVPPLNQRVEDVPVLVEHFVKKFSKKLGREINSVSPATLKAFRNYAWPGNIRELANVIERAVINTQGSVLRMTDHFAIAPVEEISIAAKTLEEIEREHIIRILGDTGWRIEGPNGGAKILGLNPSTLRTRMTKLGIQKPHQTVV